MALNPYASCPCGSGKKFKWCCEPIYTHINRALEQDTQGQHEAALRLMEEVTAQHPGNPEAWGQKAKLLFNNGKLEEAESALQKAFDINPNYPFGLLLRAVFRFQEGEVAGALLLARRAAAAYDPEALDYLGEVYTLIFECETRRNNPVAARAALRIVLRCHPGDQQIRDTFDAIFGDQGRLPACARREYTLLGPAPSVAGTRRAAWDRALADATSPRLGDLPGPFETLTKEDPQDAPAWFNLGLARAWLGDNAAAVEALNRYLERETDDTRAAVAATLAEVLRCGQGLEDQSDYVEYSYTQVVRDPQAVLKFLQDLHQAHRLIATPTQEEGTFLGVVLEMTTAALLTVGRPAADAGRLAGYVMVAGNYLRVWGPMQEPFQRLRDEARQALGASLGESSETRGPIGFHDAVGDAMIFPLKQADEKAALERVREHVEKYYEDTWIHKPRRSLAGTSPVDAAAHGALRKRLLGVIQFLQDCAVGGMIGSYDFDRLRRKLGLLGAPPTPTTAPGVAPNIPAMGAAELAALKPADLSAEQLEQAWQASQRLDAEELGEHFARALAARPPGPGTADRYSLYTYLIQRVMRAGNTDAALDLVNEGEKVDCEHNEGRRRNDYELRRGQVHAKRGEAEAAQDVFQRLIERVPTNVKFRGSAAEAMLALKQAARALKFAEDGLTVARQQNDRDSEQYLQELAGAARKQMG